MAHSDGQIGKLKGSNSTSNCSSGNISSNGSNGGGGGGGGGVGSILTRSYSTSRVRRPTKELITVVNPLATLSQKDKMYLAQALKRAPSNRAMAPSTPPPVSHTRFKSADYLFDKEDDDTNIIVENNVIKAASMNYVYSIFYICLYFVFLQL